MPPDDPTRLRHILDSIDQISEFLKGRSEHDFKNDRMLQFAVVRAVEVLGEAAAGVSSETRQLAPAIPWNLIVGTRNRLIHGYFNVDLEIIWNTVTQEVPAIRSDVQKALEKLERAP